MMRLIKTVSSFIGAGARGFVALIGIAGISVALANYTMTQGAGTTFGSVIVGGVHYAQQFICDLTTPAQCASVSAAGRVSVDGSGVTQPVSGTVTANVGTGTRPVSAASGSYASGAFATGAGVDGWDVTQGATADAAATAGGTGSHSAKLRLMTSQQATTNTSIGATSESAAGSDTATSGLNGLIKRLLQSITTLNGKIDTLNTTATSPVPCLNATTSTTNSYSNAGTNPANCDLNGNLYVNAKIAAGQSVAATQSGTWTVQPGNTANTTAWLVTGTGGTFPSTQSGTWTVQPGNTANTTPWLTTPSAGATSGATPHFVVAANSNNSTNLKASAGTVYSIQTSNINASTAYFIKLYDKATAPTCGTDTPVAGYVIPPSNGGNNATIAVGKKFTLGIGYCVVAGIANSDNTSVPAATILVNVDYN